MIAKLDRLSGFFRKKGNHQMADYMDLIKDHVNKVGTSAALKSLGKDLGEGPDKQVQYRGMWEGGTDKIKFVDDLVEPYLRRHGIIPVAHAEKGTKALPVVSPKAEDIRHLGKAGGHVPIEASLSKTSIKLEEAKHLPGLEKSEDLSVIMGGKKGGAVTHFTPEVIKKLDERYGKDKWVVKSYSEKAFAGHGIYFPQKVKQMQKDAKDAIWSGAESLKKRGYSLMREGGKADGLVVGIKHKSGLELPFDSKKYDSLVSGKLRETADKVRDAAKNEKAVQLMGERDDNGKEVNVGQRYMAQPAFDVVGVTKKDRAKGKLFAPGEGRVHVYTKNGKAEVIPHATWMKNKDAWEEMPVVFETAEHKAMQKAAQDAINALPKSQRQGQIYGADVVKTKDGYRVVEANPAEKGGGSWALGADPLVIDSYVSHVVGRTPAHIRFIRGLLTKKSKKAKVGSSK